MPSVLTQVNQGSYKGHLINIDTATTTGGRKIAKKSYPNRDDQGLEDLGLDPRSYNVTIVVSSRLADNPAGYFAEKAEILRVLELAGPGLLVHPLFGKLPNMVAESWTMNEEIEDLGYGKLSVIFEPSDTTGVPVVVGPSLADLQTTTQETIAAQQGSFRDMFSVDTGLFGSPQAALAKVNDFINDIQEATSFVGEATADLQSISNALVSINDNINQLILDPLQLAQALTDVMLDIGNVFTTPASTLIAYKNLFSFGDADINLDLVTPSITQQTDNKNEFNSLVQVDALCGAYTASGQLEGLSVEEIDAVVNDLDTQFQVIAANSGVSNEVLLSLEETRTIVASFFNEERLTAAALVDVHVVRRPARLIAFDYYNDSTRGAEISEINSQPDISFIEGDIEILSD